MKPILAFIASLALTLTAAQMVAADEGQTPPRRFATVNLFFMNQWMVSPAAQPQEKPATDPSAAGQPAGGGMVGMGSMGQLPFETVRLFLDDKFIGHAIPQNPDITPTLNLASGEHKFRIECDGYENCTQTLTVLDNGSVQFLVVKLERRKAPVKTKADAGVKK